MRQDRDTGRLLADELDGTLVEGACAALRYNLAVSAQQSWRGAVPVPRVVISGGFVRTTAIARAAS